MTIASATPARPGANAAQDVRPRKGGKGRAVDHHRDVGSRDVDLDDTVIAALRLGDTGGSRDGFNVERR
jgi:hypothetical protein